MINVQGNPTDEWSDKYLLKGHIGQCLNTDRVALYGRHILEVSEL